MDSLTRTTLAAVAPQAHERLGADGDIWTVGRLAWREGRKVLVVVGARRYSRYGERMCRDLIYGLARSPVVVVSGLAYGIDSIAHRSALEVGLPTVGVPGSGLARDVLYPYGNRRLAQRILQAGGGLLSPFAPQQCAARWTFPERNRILAALADAVVVVEGTERSGTMITARAAAEYGVPVGAVPGEVGDPLREGPHALIRDGAALVRSAADCGELLGLSLPEASATGEPSGLWHNTAEPLRERVIAFLRERRGATVDELSLALSAPACEVARTLAVLEVEGVVVQEGGTVRVMAGGPAMR